MKYFAATSILLFALIASACGGSSGQGGGPVAPGPSPTGVQPVPAGFFTITPIVYVSDVNAAVDYYGKAFGAQPVLSLPGPDGKPVHAEVRLGDSLLMIEPGMAEHGVKTPQDLGGETPASLVYYVADADSVFKAAVDAGAQAAMPLEDMFWGDRYGMIVDPFGHRWGIATHKEDLTDEQVMARAKAVFEGGGGAPTPGTPATSYKPDGYHSLNVAFTVNNASEAIEFYKSALGASERSRMPMPDGRLMHAEVQIGDSVLMLSDEFQEMGSKSARTLGGSPVAVMIYVPDADAAHARASGAGASSTMPPTDMFWGDRFGQVMDPFGYRWGIATHKEDVPPDEMAERMKAQMGAGQP